jgi:hypothetical protein
MPPINPNKPIGDVLIDNGPPLATLIHRSITINDPTDADDPRADIRTATATIHPDGNLTLTARLKQPTSPTTANWWCGTSVPRPGITWGLNTDPDTAAWNYVARLRGDPELGAYAFVSRRQSSSTDQVVCPASASFDGTTYRLDFPAGCLGGAERVRMTVYVQLYDDKRTGIIGGDYAPEWAKLSDWLSLR